MATIRTSNNPKMLVWAREQIGYSLPDAAKALGISVKALEKAETGKHQLTLRQLRLAAEKYRCSFGYFYFSKPPHEDSFESVPDFRLDPNFAGVKHPRLGFEIKKARDQRAVFLDLLARTEGPVGSFKPISEPHAVIAANKIRARLNVTKSEISSLSFNQSYNYWKNKIEKDGVLVYESQHIPDESGVIGAALYYDEWPIILIKRGSKNNARKLFTLLHEYAHLTRHQSAITDSRALYAEQADSEIEASCNRLAAEILVPSESVALHQYAHLDPIEQMRRLANDFKITYSTAAVCLKRLGLIDQSSLDELLDLRQQENQKSKPDQKVDVRIPRETIVRLDLGRPMFSTVLQAYSSGVLDVFDTSKILGLRVKKIDNLVARKAQ